MYPSNTTINERLFGLLVDNVEDYAIFMVDPEGKVLTWNKGAEHIKGYTEDEITGRDFSIFYTDVDIEKNEPQRNLAKAIKHGRYECEGWRVKKNGGKFWANIVFTAIYDEEGQFLGVAKVTRDITLRKAEEDEKQRWNAYLEEKVREKTLRIITNERRFRKLIENSYDGISLFDQDLRIIYRSRSAKRITGFDASERKQQDLMAVIYAADRQIFSDALATILKEAAKPVFVTFRIIRPDSSLVWLDCIFTNMLYDADVNAIVCNFRDITEKKTDEERIKESSRQIQTILDRITDGFIALDKNFNYIYVNRKICEMTGVEPESLIGKNVWEVFPEAVGSITYQAFHEAFRRQQYIFNEDYFAPLNLWQENSIYPSPDGLSVFIRDISERKQADASLRESLTKLQQAAAMQAEILDALPPAIVLLNESLDIIAVNQSWRKFVSRNKTEYKNYGIGENYLNFCIKNGLANSGQYAGISRGISDVVDGVLPEFVTEYFCALKAEKKWIQLIAAPVSESAQKGAVVLHIDITAHKVAEENLLQSEANLRSVFENTDLSIVLFNNDLNIVSFNSNAFRQSIRNFEKRLKPGTHAYNYFPEERWAVINEIVGKVKKGDAVYYETEYILKNGEKEWFDARWVGVTNNEKENVGIILTLKNITEKKQTSLEREKITADLIQRNKDLEQFTYIVSHNLRAPVANIKGLTDLLTSCDIPDPELQETIDALILSVTRLDNVIVDLNGILQAANRVNEKIELVSLPELVDEVCNGLKAAIAENNVTVQCNFKINQIFCIKSYLYSIFHNMITNSIKYSKTNHFPDIRIHSALKGDMVEITFRDKGKGIDLQKFGSHIFGLYKRFDLTVDGKGMGLFMVKTQVESMGGKITVKSEVGKGTEFKIQLPV